MTPDLQSTLDAKRPAFAACLAFAALKALLVLLGGNASLWSWVLIAAIAGVVWIEEPRSRRRIDSRGSR